jgi:hypothetical protein
LLIPITGRTGNWLAHGITYWPGYYAPLAKYRDNTRSEIPGIIQRLSDTEYFQPFWLNEDVLIVAVRPAPGVPVEGIGGPWTGAVPAASRTTAER